jgi:phage shock protein A
MMLNNPTLGGAVIAGLFVAWGGLCGLAGTTFNAWRTAKTQLATATVAASTAHFTTEQQALIAEQQGNTQFATAYLANMKNLAELWEAMVVERDAKIAKLDAAISALEAICADMRAKLDECERRDRVREEQID